MNGDPLEASPDAVRLVDAARFYLGAPWRHLGRSGMLGVDCIGLVLAAAADAGLPAEFTAQPPAYAKGHRGPEFLAALRARCPRIPLELAAPGDVLDGTPVVGDDVARPFDSAADASTACSGRRT